MWRIAGGSRHLVTQIGWTQDGRDKIRHQHTAYVLPRSTLGPLQQSVLLTSGATIGFVPFLGYHHILMILIAIAIILLSLLLAGCSSSSPLIPGIFLISIYYQSYPPSFDPAQVDPGVTTAIANIVGQAQLEVRVGYFGICINPDGGSFLCSNNASSLAQQVTVDQDPLNLIWVASTFKDSIVFPYLMYVSSSSFRAVIAMLTTVPIVSLRLFSPSSAFSSSPLSRVGTKKLTIRAPTGKSNHFPQDQSPRSHLRSFSSPPSLCSYLSYGSIRLPSVRARSRKTWVMGASRAGLVQQQWY